MDWGRCSPMLFGTTPTSAAKLFWGKLQITLQRGWSGREGEIVIIALSRRSKQQPPLSHSLEERQQLITSKAHVCNRSSAKNPWTKLDRNSAWAVPSESIAILARRLKQGTCQLLHPKLPSKDLHQVYLLLSQAIGRSVFVSYWFLKPCWNAHRGFR